MEKTDRNKLLVWLMLTAVAVIAIMYLLRQQSEGTVVVPATTGNSGSDAPAIDTSPVYGAGLPPRAGNYSNYNIPAYNPPSIGGNSTAITFPPGTHTGTQGSGKGGSCGCNTCCIDTNPLQPGVEMYSAFMETGG